MLSENEAFKIAAKAISEKQKKSKYNDFSPIALEDENDFFWTFVSGSQLLINDGYVPGAFFVSVDKTDGHIWTRREEEIFYQSQSIPELQTA